MLYTITFKLILSYCQWRHFNNNKKKTSFVVTPFYLINGIMHKLG